MLAKQSYRMFVVLKFLSVCVWLLTLSGTTFGHENGASKPFITTILDATNDRSLLQCEVRGASPEPKVEWKHSSGNILPAEEPQVSERGGRYDVTLNITVTKTGRYRCEVTQEEISHQTSAETFVFISEKLCEDQTTRVDVGWLGGFILGAAVFAVVQAAVLVGLKATKCITLSCNRGPAVKVVVKEDSDAVLPCLISTKENITATTFDWKKDGQKEVFLYDAGIHYNNGRQGQDEQFRGRVSHFQDQLEYGNASIKINNTKVTDSGIYSCIFPRLQPSQTFNIELVVERLLKDRSGEISGASKPVITTILDQAKGRLLLQCEVREAYPEPKVEWKNSSGNILPAEEPQVSESGGRYDVTLNITVTETGRYRCEVTQREIKHHTSAETTVHISGGSPQVSQRGDCQYVNTTVTDHDCCNVTREEISHQNCSNASVNISSVSEEVCEDCSTKVHIGWLVGGIVIAAAVVAAVVAAVLFGLRATKCITISFNRGAAPEPTATSADPTNDIPLLQDGVNGDHQHQNGSSKAPTETTVV